MTETAQPRWPMTALISASLLSIGVGYTATAPYDAVIAIEALKISHGDFALILTIIGAAVLVAAHNVVKRQPAAQH